jgi:hypothetical protein
MHARYRRLRFGFEIHVAAHGRRPTLSQRHAPTFTLRHALLPPMILMNFFTKIAAQMPRKNAVYFPAINPPEHRRFSPLWPI